MMIVVILEVTISGKGLPCTRKRGRQLKWSRNDAHDHLLALRNIHRFLNIVTILAQDTCTLLGQRQAVTFQYHDRPKQGASERGIGLEEPSLLHSSNSGSWVTQKEESVMRTVIRPHGLSSC